MKKKSPEKKQDEQIEKEETHKESFNMITKNKIPFLKVVRSTHMDFTKRVNYLIEQDIINNTKI